MNAFTPPYPKPQDQPASFLKRLVLARHNVLRLLKEKHYSTWILRWRLPGRTIAVVSAPREVRRILVEEWQKFPKSTFLVRILGPAITIGVLISKGELWKRQRRMIDPAFDQHSLEELFPLMAGAVATMAERFERLDLAAPIEADVEMTRVTADIICRATCSVALGDREGTRLFDAFARLQNDALLFGTLGLLWVPGLITPVGWRMRRAGREIREIVGGFARERFDAGRRGEADPRKDILSALIVAEDPETGERFGFDELVEHMIVIFIAGHETTASTLAWVLHALANCPHVQQSVYEEVISVTGGRDPQFADIKRMPRVRDVLRETLRLYPPVGFFVRDSESATTICGQAIRRGQMVAVSPWIVHRHRQLWERPNEFDPDRFKTDSAKASLKRAYMPFGLGPRACMGAGFAMQEGALIIAALVSRYRFAPVPEHQPETAGRLTIRSRNGILVRMERRPGANVAAPAA
jgi:cytochrome P450